MSDQKNSGEAIAQHIAGLEAKIRSEQIAAESLQEELGARAVEMVTLGAQFRSQKRINADLVETVQKTRAEIQSQRTMFTETTLELQRQHNETRTSLERSERELEAERGRPLGNADFIMHLVTINAAQWLKHRLMLACIHRAFTQRGLTRLQGLVLNSNLQGADQIELPDGLQEIVKAYCTTTRTAFDSGQLLADVSNYVENNQASILELDAVQELFDFRQSIVEVNQTEQLVQQYLQRIACPDVLKDFVHATASDHTIDREQHEHALLESVKEITVSFIEDISFEIPISLE